MCHCGLPVKAKGLCAKHYLAEYRKRKEAGSIIKTPIQAIYLSQALVRVEGKTFTNCAVETCDSPIKAKGICSKHYLRLNRAKKKAN